MLLVGMPNIEDGQTGESMKEDGATRSHIRSLWKMQALESSPLCSAVQEVLRM